MSSPIQYVFIGNANAGQGNTLFQSFSIVNNNFSWLSNVASTSSNYGVNANVISTGTSTFNNVVIGNVVGNLTSTGYFIGNGSQLTGITSTANNAVSAGTAEYVTQATQANITAVGTLTGLTLSGAVTGTSINAATIGNSGAALVGTITTNAQPNINSVGVLNAVSIASNSSITAVNLVIGNVTGITRTIAAGFGANVSGNLDISFLTYTSQFAAYNINANVTLNVSPIVSAGVQKFVVFRNVNGSTQYVILPNAFNNKASNTIAIATNTTATFVLTSFDTNVGNIVATITSS